MVSLYLTRLGRADVSHFGEKSPAHTGRLRTIKRLFDDAKIIFIYRDGRDVALSLSKVPWAHKDVYINFIIWMYYASLLEQARTWLPSDFLCVKYEELASNPSGELAKIIDFLGLSYEAAVAEAYGNSEGIPVDEYGWKSRALGRITSDRIGLWREMLSETEISVLERLGRGSLERMGYSLMTDARARLSARFYFRLCCGLFGLAWHLPWGLLANELMEAVAAVWGSWTSRISREVLLGSRLSVSQGEDAVYGNACGRGRSG
jgi:hypothetical protein